MLPVPLEDSDTIKLQAVLALSISLIARSPDEEMEVWLSDIIRKVRTELKARSGKLTLVPSTEPDGSLNFDPNYVDDPSHPPFCPGNGLKAAQGRVLDW
jgi:predicted Zn-ribbon and HTH transcriptional regulator